ncbi:hypothetical protein [uncultured Aquimarina sp.]|uniref:hypothetical protein n=1 Tax=uncultured Aquimarina sp. TaxID=575652 RepID=UPI00260C0C3B|nr:hypothetical protein [uncultured Aquimarina sp.]
MNSDNKIRIEKGKKDRLIISYEYDEGDAEIEINPEFIYDIIISLFERQSKNLINENSFLITLEEFYKIEGEKRFWQNTFDKVKMEEETKGITQRNIGGNRILVEYYKGRLIFQDDLRGYGSNVIEWKS